MSRHTDQVERLTEEFAACRKLLQALGDETRQHIILEMAQMHQCEGVRVGAITERTHLSRPAVSHHIRILKEAGILKMRREGAMNFYSFDVSAASLRQLGELFAHITDFMSQLPVRDEPEEHMVE
ncbi:MAG: ArsR/SmtB family transcription factor [Aristaeellaceae bacterium]